MTSAAEILKKYWGYTNFRPLQAEAIAAAVAKTDTLVLLPTGGGKSVCYQVPGLMQEGVTVVISPLIALMNDQVEALRRKGINAMAITSGMTKREIDIAFDNAVYGNVKFLYLSPERLGTDLAQERLKRMNVNLIAVDEAHCISAWGHDFRPAYRKIAEVRKLLPTVPILALTATATPEVINDIQTQLAFSKPNVLSQSFYRANLSYAIRNEEDKRSKLLEIVQRVKGSGLVYCRNRATTKELAEYLMRNQLSASFYHAGLTTTERATKQNQWLAGRTRIMICTNAFGMGIDKADVRFVIHYDMPESPEAYFQEAGRAGRDGQRAYGVLLANGNEQELAEEQIKNSFPTVEQIRIVYKALGNYFSLAEGAGLDKTFNFDLPEFCRTYNLDRLQVYGSLKALEREGYITLTDAVYEPPKLFFTVDNAGLYNFQIQNPKMDSFLKGILRLYGGLFEGYVKIDFNHLAKNLAMQVNDVVLALSHLKKAGVADFVMPTDSPRVTYLQPRLNEREVLFDSKQYLQLKEAYTKRLQTMVAYTQNNSQCRNQILLNYFGDNSITRCGICDFCLSTKEQTVEEPVNMIEIVLNVIETQSVTPNQLVDKLIDHKAKDIKLAMAQIITEGKVKLDDFGVLVKVF